MGKIADDTRRILDAFWPIAKLQPGQILVVGCSTSEVSGHSIGKGSSLEVAEEIFAVLKDYTTRGGVHLAIQCCEHLNRAVVVSEACAMAYDLTEVSVIPVVHAGGSMATTAFKEPDTIVVESLNGKAHAGIDIGDTLIGMHLRPVAVPVRIADPSIGQGHVVLARTRPKLIGGARAVYEKVEEVRPA
jgi:uncharacterized protein (TIGR01440 family)